MATVWIRQTADRNTLINDQFTYNYKQKCESNIISMKSNHLIYQTQHFVSIAKVQRYIT